jgi:hypothetical protein
MEEFIQILTPEGKRAGDFDISFFPPFEDVNFLACEVLSPDGRVLTLDPDEIREDQGQKTGEYETARRKFFSLPGVVPGALLHVHYRSQWKDFPMPHISMALPIGHELPVREQTIEISVGRDMAFHFALEQAAAADPGITKTAYGTTYRWKLTDLPAWEREPLSPPGRKPRLLVSTFPDWRAFAEWYERITRPGG